MKERKLKFLNKCILAFIILGQFSYAEDAGHSVSGQIEDIYYEETGSYSETVDSSLLEEVDGKGDKSSPFFPDMSKKTEKYEELPAAQRALVEDTLNSPSKNTYYTFRLKDDLKKYENKGKTDFSINYIKDGYSYSDRNGIFNRTFEDEDKGIKAGTLLFSLNKYLSRTKILNTKIGMNIGLGFNQGEGSFLPDPVSGLVEKSGASIKLWTIPIEFSLGAEFILTRYFKLQGSAGPTLMALVQSRSDKEDDNELKRKRQIGYGYFAMVAFKTSLSDFFHKSIGSKTLIKYDMSKMSLDVFLRHQNVANFKNKDFKITGTSLGLGLTFEYL